MAKLAFCNLHNNWFTVWILSYITWHELVNSDVGNLHRSNANLSFFFFTF